MKEQSKSKNKLILRSLLVISFVIRLLSDLIPVIIYNEVLNGSELLVLILMSSFHVAFLILAFGKSERVPLIVGYVLLVLINLFSLIRCIRSLGYYSDFYSIEWLIETLIQMATHIALLVFILNKKENKSTKVIVSAVAFGITSLGLLIEFILSIKGQVIIWSVAYQIGLEIFEFAMLFYFKTTNSLKDELKEAKKRFESGIISEEEYSQLKESIMNRL